MVEKSIGNWKIGKICKKCAALVAQRPFMTELPLLDG
jgi:hypothetical protein